MTLGNMFLKATPDDLRDMLGYLDSRTYHDDDIRVFLDWVHEQHSLIHPRFMVEAMARSGYAR